MKYVISDLSKFPNCVFGANDLIRICPELLTTGVNIIKKNDLYYICDNNGNELGDCIFFSEDEMQYLSAFV